MTDIAQLRFQSNLSPAENGALVLSDDGTFRIEPSDKFRDEMARLEEVALQRSQTYGTRLGIGLILVGLAAIGVGWLFGRIFGKIGSTLSEPRPIDDVHITREPGGGVRVKFAGNTIRLQTVEMAWHGDEIVSDEADIFMSKYEEIKG